MLAEDAYAILWWLREEFDVCRFLLPLLFKADVSRCVSAAMTIVKVSCWEAVGLPYMQLTSMAAISHLSLS